MFVHIHQRRKKRQGNSVFSSWDHSLLPAASEQVSSRQQSSLETGRYIQRCSSLMPQEFLNRNKLKIDIKHGNSMGKGSWVLQLKFKRQVFGIKKEQILTLLVRQLIFQPTVSNTKVCYVQTQLLRDKGVNALYQCGVLKEYASHRLQCWHILGICLEQ